MSEDLWQRPVPSVLVTAGPAAATATTFTPVADTYVQDTTPTTTNYGGASQVNVDNSPVRQMFLKFTVSGLTDPVTSAKLRIHVNDIPNGGSTS
jgi:hypothetical protein